MPHGVGHTARGSLQPGWNTPEGMYLRNSEGVTHQHECLTTRVCNSSVSFAQGEELIVAVAVDPSGFGFDTVGSQNALYLPLAVQTAIHTVKRPLSFQEPLLQDPIVMTKQLKAEA